jgi:hypothetical protein
MRPVVLLIATAFTILISLGCSTATTVHGEIKLDGQPIDGGAIMLNPLPGTAGFSVGGTITAGQYQLSGASAPLPGKYQVVVRWVRKTGRQVPLPTNPQGDERVDEIGETLPAKYNDQSTLQAEVKPGPNQFDFELTTK